MRRSISLIFILFVAVSLIFTLTAQAADIRLYACSVNPSESGSPRVFLGYTSDGDYAATSGLVLGSNGLVGDMPQSIEAGDHPQVFGVELSTDEPVTWFVYSADFAYELPVTADAPPCESSGEAGTGQPDGGLDTITVYDVQGEMFRWQIRDEWGNWHDIGNVQTPLQCESERCFTRLVLGAGSSTDPEDYRVFPVENNLPIE